MPDISCYRFNFYNTVVFELYTDAPQAETFFNAEYQSHRVEELPEGVPTVRLHFRYDPVSVSAPSGMTYHSHKLLARWSYNLRFSNPQKASTRDRIEIEAVGNYPAIPMIHHMLIHPSLRYLCARHGMVMLHSGSVVKNGRSLIFTGRGGTGKTTATSLILAYGGINWSLHSDDYTFLTPEPASFEYLTRSHLYLDLLRWIPEINERLTFAERVRLGFFGWARSLSGERLKWPVRLSADRLWPDRQVTVRASPAGILFLRRSDIREPQLLRLEYEPALLQELLEMNFREARHYLHLVEKTQAASGFSGWLEDWKQAESKLIETVLRQTPIYRLEFPIHKVQIDPFCKQLINLLDGLVEN